MNKIFVPHQLKTITVDTEKKIFRINGEDFGKDCTGFTITCNSYKDFNIHMEIQGTVRYITIREGKCVSDEERPVRASWYSE